MSLRKRAFGRTLPCVSLILGAIGFWPGTALMAGAPQAGSAAAVSPSPTPKPKLTVLHRHATADGRVVAYWMGIDPRGEDANAFLPAATEELWFEFREPGAPRGRWVRYHSKGDLFFSDWTFDVFSEDDAVVVLQQDHYGPFHIVWTRNLESYLRGRSRPAQVVPGPLAKGEIGAVHKFLGWRSKRTFEFRRSCCASQQHCRHTIGSRRPTECGPFEETTEH
jgi:hypothetical protein